MGNCCSTGENKHKPKEKPKTNNKKSVEKRLEVDKGMEEAKEQNKENLPIENQKGTFPPLDKNSENKIHDQNLPASIAATTVTTEVIAGNESETTEARNKIDIIASKKKTSPEQEDKANYSKNNKHPKDTYNAEGRALELDAAQNAHPEVVITQPTSSSHRSHKHSESGSSSSKSERIARRRKEKLGIEPAGQEIEEAKVVVIKTEKIQRSESEESSPSERYDKVEMPVKKDAVKLPSYQPETRVNPSITVARKDSPKLQTTYDERHIQTITELKTPEVKTVPTSQKAELTHFERENSSDSSEEDRKKRKNWKFLKSPKLLEEQKRAGYTVSKNEIINEREYSPAVFKTTKEKMNVEDKSKGLVLKESSSSYSSSDEEIGTIKTVDKLPHMNRRILGEIQNSSNLKESIIGSRVIYPPTKTPINQAKAVHVRVPENLPQKDKTGITSPRYIKREVSSSSSSSYKHENISPKPIIRTNEIKDTKANTKPEATFTVKKWSELRSKESSSSESDSDVSPVKSQVKVPSKFETKSSKKMLKNHTPTFKPETAEAKLTQARRPVPGKVETSPVYNQKSGRVGVQASESSSSYSD